MTTKAVAVIAGAGPGTGAAIARRFAKSYGIALLARSASSYQPLVQEISSSGGRAIGISTDVSDGTSVKSAFEQITTAFPGAALAAAVYNVGGWLPSKPFLQLSEDDFKAGFESNALGAFHFSQAAIPLLLNAGNLQYPPTLIFTGATASFRGSARLGPFSSGKFALRALSQSLAREFGPEGIHVSHVIVDGVIDTDQTRTLKAGTPDAKLDPKAIADTYWHLHSQPKSAFTQELDLRPAAEQW
ncbi:hypothetical protein LOZ12_005888 [Ophidiomyces ophidiicola]|uniref:Uncharacterized protein n=1 Tax=Ophidiomyces ophidiicola TaxID=1387563 RepID=A0ACB8UMY0_9EURO|nr:hypothetical protein LOZ64_006486 [Ophidiomyces ophidiicola]KAI1906332.1 hypothetical protein LOZ61_006719 [Ophidiomyces ophidiicola]KAI1919581.1 hypothetical protein LOZ65_004344 [Ophidiomyces ophidiicola]KAI1930038.1 hypothetical protein LOZ60_001297 [Ophidiomyces ophidiicola]KAI1934831.1 hypothetical protein LOZ66_005688 [Ophidiomyces ophidiicola]